MPDTFRGNRLPTFPGTWYHPVYGAKEIKSIEDYQKLDHNWREKPEIADMDRTETEAQTVMLHNQLIKHGQLLEEAKKLKIGGEEGEKEEGWAKRIVRNSVQAQESVNRGDVEPL